MVFIEFDWFLGKPSQKTSFLSQILILKKNWNLYYPPILSFSNKLASKEYLLSALSYDVIDFLAKTWCIKKCHTMEKLCTE